MHSALPNQSLESFSMWTQYHHSRNVNPESSLVSQGTIMTQMTNIIKSKSSTTVLTSGFQSTIFLKPEKLLPSITHYLIPTLYTNMTWLPLKTTTSKSTWNTSATSKSVSETLKPPDPPKTKTFTSNFLLVSSTSTVKQRLEALF